MSGYYCDLCEAERATEICGECGLPTRRSIVEISTQPVLQTEPVAALARSPAKDGSESTTDASGSIEPVSSTESSTESSEDTLATEFGRTTVPPVDGSDAQEGAVDEGDADEGDAESDPEPNVNSEPVAEESAEAAPAEPASAPQAEPASAPQAEPASAPQAEPASDAAVELLSVPAASSAQLADRRSPSSSRGDLTRVDRARRQERDSGARDRAQPASRLPRTAPPRTAPPRTAPPRTAPPRTAPRREALAGQQEIEEYLANGFEIFLIVGIAGAGKTELLEAIRGGGHLATVKRLKGRAMPTSPSALHCYPFTQGRRKLVFVDASGEHFQRLYNDPSKDRHLAEHDIGFGFLQFIAKHLSGVVLLLNLGDLWRDGESSLAQREQSKILCNILILLRWLRGGGRYRSGARSLEAQVDSQVKAMAQLKMPVQLLFSKTDELNGVPVPQGRHERWLKDGDAAARSLFPLGEEPLLLTHHALPEMLTALEEHCRLFRVDFVHSLHTDAASLAVIDNEGCGVEQAGDWLVQASRWSRLPMISTKAWIAVQRWLDEKLRRRRWWHLPAAKTLDDLLGRRS